MAQTTEPSLSQPGADESFVKPPAYSWATANIVHPLVVPGNGPIGLA